MSSTNNAQFGPWRSFFWPIHRWEVKKFVPLLILYALVCLIYNLLKTAKDALVVTAPESGAIAIPFIKIWGIFPTALIVTLILSRLLNKISLERLFYIMIGSFLFFFLIFATVFYPLRDIIHPNKMADQLQLLLPHGFQGLISIFRNWSYTLFYVVSEFWGTVIMSIIFWAFVNEIMTVKDAKRVYGILNIGANIAAICSGQIVIVFSEGLVDLSFLSGADSWERCLRLTIGLVICVGLISIFLFRWYNLNVIKRDPSLSHVWKHRRARPNSVKMGLRANFSYLLQSKYLFCIAILVVAFNITTNMLDLIWKDQLSLLYPNPNDFNSYMGKVLTFTGVLSTFVGFFLCGNVMRRVGWTVSALITPVALLITGTLFVGFLLLKGHPLCLSWMVAMGWAPLIIGVLFGTIQNVLSRSCKFTLFDTTKEIAFIPLNSELKLQGKAAIDGLMSRAGKMSGSLLHSGLLVVFGGVSLSTPFVGLFLLFIVFGWILATRSLGHQFTHLTSHDKTLDIRIGEPTLDKGLSAQKT